MAPVPTQCPSPLRHPSPSIRSLSKAKPKGLFKLEQQTEMKIAVCQFDIEFANRWANEEKVKAMLSHHQKGDFDLLVFPEMSFTGYCFDNREEIESFLEDERGPTFMFSQWIASTYGCFVVAGYPQLDRSTGKCYNSVCLVSPDGELVTTYQKTHLYTTDYVWCGEGPGFTSVPVEGLNKKLGFGICMDLNAYQFGDDRRFEFANFHLEAKTDIVIVLANWLDDPYDEYWANSTQSYWASRLTPLFEQNHKCHAVICNRIGTEKGYPFCGGSCVIDVGQHRLISTLSKRDEAILITSVPL